MATRIDKQVQSKSTKPLLIEQEPIADQSDNTSVVNRSPLSVGATPPLDPKAILKLQSLVGNQAVQRIIQNTKASASSSTARTIPQVQRCACGKPIKAGGTCADCQRKEAAIQRQVVDTPLLSHQPDISEQIASPQQALAVSTPLAAIPANALQRHLEAAYSTTLSPANNVVQRNRGDCTDEEHRILQDAVDEMCKNRPRACDSTMSVPELEERIANNAACIAARNKINGKCFKGGDAGHIEAVQTAINALNNCHRIKERQTNPGRNPAPLINPEAARRIATAAAIGGGIGMVVGAIIGGVGGGIGGTAVAPGVGTVGVGAAGGVAGAAYGAAAGGVVGGAIGGGLEALYEWLH